MNFMNLFSRLSELSWRLFPTGKISPKSENKYSKSEYGSVSGVFQSPELREQKKKEKSPDFQFSIFNVLAKNVEAWLIICASHSWSITRLG
jgi:hypothetical protein